VAGKDAVGKGAGVLPKDLVELSELETAGRYKLTHVRSRVSGLIGRKQALGGGPR
jgi:hypothetical protein